MAHPPDSPAQYINRELSWLAFNRRVLEEAEDEHNPLLERVKFLAITASNLDEFVEVRLAALLQLIEMGMSESGPDGLTPTQQLTELAPALHQFTQAQYRCWNQSLRPRLAQERVRVLGLEEMSPAARRFAREYCAQALDPLLTPITVDPAHPFPRVLNKALCLAFLLRPRRRRGEVRLGVVTVPRTLPRLIRLPSAAGGHDFLYIAHLVAWHARSMYRGFAVEGAAAFRVTRNSNLYLREESRNLMESVRLELHNRRRGTAVRLEIEAGAAAPAAAASDAQEIAERLRLNFELDPWQVFSAPGPVHLSRLMALYEQTPRTDLKFVPYLPPAPPAASATPDELFARLREGDQLLHHPYDSFQGTARFIEAAAADPRVLAIRQTLYRTGADSPILRALTAAAARKEVAVVVELQARFDEELNIRWARQLENAGVQVSYGVVGRKTHCKLALAVRRDEDGALRRYLHLGTGNYNRLTAAHYTDFSLLTARAELTAAAHAVFGYLTAGTEPTAHAPLWIGPLDLAPRLLELIAREAEHARRGRRGRIVLKVNGLLDRQLIAALYAASQAGVQIDMLVRGMCALRPGRRGWSENITVRSLVGRFLEHSRIFYFGNGSEREADDAEVYLGSADGMPRNLYERVEVVFPVLDASLRQRLRQEILAAYLADTAQTRWLEADGTYRRPHGFASGFSAQQFFMDRSLGRATLDDIPESAARP